VTFEQITEVLAGQCYSKPNNERVFEFGFSSDLMSDVLTIKSENLVLLTGLYNPQALRAAEIADIHCVVFSRNKKLPQELVELAKELGIGVIKTPFSMFKCSGLLFSKGLKPLY
jgi:hypothetical protein